MRLSAQQRSFAEEVPLPECCDLGAAAGHHGVPFQNKEEGVAHHTLLDDNLSVHLDGGLKSRSQGLSLLDGQV